MKKQWEYLVVDLCEFTEEAALEQEFDSHGEEGWELVSVNDTHAYFKRRLPSVVNEGPNNDL